MLDIADDAELQHVTLFSPCRYVYVYVHAPTPVPAGLRHGSTATRWLGLRVRIPPSAWRSVSCDRCVLSGRGLCVGLIAPPEES